MCKISNINQDSCGLQSLETAAIKIGYDLNIFKRLSDAKDPVLVEEIAQSTNAEPLLIRTLPLSSPESVAY